MRGMARFRQGRLAPWPTAFGMLARGLCALVGLGQWGWSVVWGEAERTAGKPSNYLRL